MSTRGVNGAASASYRAAAELPDDDDDDYDDRPDAEPCRGCGSPYCDGLCPEGRAWEAAAWAAFDAANIAPAADTAPVACDGCGREQPEPPRGWITDRWGYTYCPACLADDARRAEIEARDRDLWRATWA